MNTKKVTTILITLIVIEFSIIGIFIKDYKNSLVTVSIVNDNNIKLSNAFTKVKEDTVNKEVDNNKKITIRFYNIDNNSSSYKSNITIPNEEINPKEVEKNIDPVKEEKTIINDIVIPQDPKEDIINEKTITIEDRSNGECAMALEFYYQDYYFTCIKSHNVIVTVNGKSYTIKEALNNKIVTMDELISVGFKPLKKNTYAIK
ncbi:unknown [Mycoplasma sp. CAG:472]|nr:unknown [Mycoplasma sp. CAG:472]